MTPVSQMTIEELDAELAAIRAVQEWRRKPRRCKRRAAASILRA